MLIQSQEIWNECVETPFVQELGSGELPLEKFRVYMIQDSIYLKHYARILGKAIFHAKSMREIQMYHSSLSFVTDTESSLRLDYLKEFGMTDDDIENMPMFRENQNYVNFLGEIADKGELPEILMAILPCILSYCYIFKKLAAQLNTSSSRYSDFISEYADEKFDQNCLNWESYADELCSNLPKERKEKLSNIFEKASRFELDFWKMSYRATDV